MVYLSDRNDGDVYRTFQTEEEAQEWIKEICEIVDGIIDYHGYAVELI